MVERRLRGGRREELAIPCPGVVTVTADSVEPRYVSARARRDAARRGVETWSLADLGLARTDVRAAGAGFSWNGSTGRGRGPPDRRGRRAGARALGRRPPSPAGRRRQSAPAPAMRPPPASTRGCLEGDPRAVADRIMAFLEQHGFV